MITKGTYQNSLFKSKKVAKSYVHVYKYSRYFCRSALIITMTINIVIHFISSNVYI